MQRGYSPVQLAFSFMSVTLSVGSSESSDSGLSVCIWGISMLASGRAGGSIMSGNERRRIREGDYLVECVVMGYTTEIVIGVVNNVGEGGRLFSSWGDTYRELSPYLGEIGRWMENDRRASVWLRAFDPCNVHDMLEFVRSPLEGRFPRSMLDTVLPGKSPVGEYAFLAMEGVTMTPVLVKSVRLAVSPLQARNFSQVVVTTEPFEGPRQRVHEKFATNSQAFPRWDVIARGGERPLGEVRVRFFAAVS